jgi:hypothetical protein
LSVGQRDKKVDIMSILVSTNELFSKYFCEALAKKVSDFISRPKVRNLAKHDYFRAANIRRD